ncbi:MAG TPA: preprotein translocase subunit SecE [bacterium]|nr:preprotein translocase subunit SecE [bacterium]
MRKIVDFLKECVAELKKVSWSGRKEVIGATILVVVLVLILSVFISMVDLGLAVFFRQFLG